MANLYWQDSGSQAWEDPLNWWVDDAAIIPAGFAPWIDSDVPPTYLGYDLTLALGAVNAPVIGVAIGTDATGTCDIVGLGNNGNINGGTFSGNGFTNGLQFSGTIEDGIFSGDGFINNGSIINGGTFSGDGFSNNVAVIGGYASFVSIINGGTFTGNGFTNNPFTDEFATYYSTINGDCTFTGEVFNYSVINNGTFSGSGIIGFPAILNFGSVNGGIFIGAEYHFYNGGLVNGGTFSGGNFRNNGNIVGGTFSGSGFEYLGGAISGGTFIAPAVYITNNAGNTIVSVFGGGPEYVYPTPPSGGGSDQMIARLLNLPWFINL